MLSMMEKPAKSTLENRINFDGHTEKCRLNRVLQRNSQRKLQRNSWILSGSTKSESSQPPPRSTSADSSKKPRISCDVSNLKVVGKRSNLTNTRASTPEYSAESTITKVQIKKPLLKSPECSLKPEAGKTRLSRSRQILKELQRQVKNKWYGSGCSGFYCNSSSTLVLHYTM